MNKPLKKQRFLLVLLDTILLACLTVGCGPVVTLPIARVTTPASVVRVVPRVWAGTYITPTPLPEILDNMSHNLATGDYVQTNHDGVARLTIGACTNVYLYNDSSLTKGYCTPSGSTSGAWNCVTGALTSTCQGAINIVTPSAKVQTSGTSLTVLYLPETQLTIVQVIEGSVTVTPFLEIPTSQDVPAPEGKSQSLGDASFWFTVPGPDENQPFIGGLPGRQPIMLEQWPQFMAGMPVFDPMGVPQLDTWMAQICLRSVIDGSPFPRQLLPGITINGEGPLMARPDMQDAIISAVDWNRWREQFFPGRDLRMTAIFPGRVLSDVMTSKFDIEGARLKINDARQAGVDTSLLLVFPNYGPEFESAYKWIQSVFEEIGLTLKTEFVDPAELNNRVYTHIKDGESVLWINSGP